VSTLKYAAVGEYSEYRCRYIPKDNRLYLIDKEHSIVSFQVRIVRIGYGEWKMRAWMMEIRVRIMRNGYHARTSARP
jgi:hypothetical protein